jgi:hypothetical protein
VSQTWLFRVLSFIAALARLQPLAAQERNASDWQRPSLECEPSCRSGFECRRGECMPLCSPACGDGFLCSAGGSCVRPEPEVVPEPPPSAAGSGRTQPTNICMPSCRTGFSCMSGHCVSACNPACSVGETCTQNAECISSQLPESRGEEPSVDPAPPPQDSIVNLHLDVLGALQFGLTPTVEVGERVSGFLRLRALNSGLASYFLLGRNRDDELSWGAGAAVGSHLFFAGHGNMRGMLVGLALEYAFLETKETTNDFARHRTHSLIPQLDVGYRWALGSLLVDVGGRLGVAIPFSNTSRPIGAGGCRRAGSCDEKLDVAVIPSAFLDLGWFIPRS